MAMIEDIDYLLEHCEQNSLTIFVDSGNRDRLQYAQPNDYVVNFDQPIRNVFGIEILDASLPVTAYNVDITTNTFGFTNVFCAMGVNMTEFYQLMSSLQFCPAFDSLFSGLFSANIFLCASKTGYDNMTNIVDSPTTNMVIYTVVCPFQSSGHQVIIEDITYYLDDPYVATKIGEGTLQTSCHVTSTGIIYFEWKFCLDAQTIAYIQDIDRGSFDIVLCNTVLKIDIGNYNSDSLLQTMNDILINPSQFVLARYTNGVFQMSYSDTTTGNNSKTTLYTYSYNKPDPFILDMRKSTSSIALGFSEYAVPSSTWSVNGYGTFTYGTNFQLYVSFGNTATSQFLKSPGIVNLESARYILLRCPEIENQMLGSYGNFKYSPGISLFKMTDTSSMQQLRFDFVNIVRRPFHPIGKLPRLSFTFENQDGSLYDFKCVDHQILLSIKYYSPKNVRRVPFSRLNPYYNPNVLEFQLDKPQEPKKEYNVDEIILQQKKFF